MRLGPVGLHPRADRLMKVGPPLLLRTLPERQDSVPSPSVALPCTSTHLRECIPFLFLFFYKVWEYESVPDTGGVEDWDIRDDVRHLTANAT